MTGGQYVRITVVHLALGLAIGAALIGLGCVGALASGARP